MNIPVGKKQYRGAAQKLDDLIAKYPVAALYVQAESYSRASNFRKAAAGKEASPSR